MEEFITMINRKLGNGEITITEFLVDYLYVQQCLSDDDYINYINNKEYLPTFTYKAPSNLIEDMDDVCRRENILQNKHKLIIPTLNMFD